jgi:hypothetical protein
MQLSCQYSSVLVWLLFVLWSSYWLSFCFISIFALMLVCFISDLGSVPVALSKFLKKWTKNKINYRSPRCMQTNCRSVCYRHLNISSDSTYTPTHLLIVPYKYKFLYNDNIKVILYIELKTVVVYAINVLSYKTKN